MENCECFLQHVQMLTIRIQFFFAANKIFHYNLAFNHRFFYFDVSSNTYYRSTAISAAKREINSEIPFEHSFKEGVNFVAGISLLSELESEFSLIFSRDVSRLNRMFWNQNVLFQ